eukprot:TRINITY_DN3130_c0_g2_i2.p2 TRINITY_DN3130_c0_g2~~TRINITY_DN3130_c0_g2_i2.p2  ORF type:complete len:154 (+),score=19.59 TRINITY_DN3130_c0_g2_i2:1066-1527(+)
MTNGRIRVVMGHCSSAFVSFNQFAGNLLTGGFYQGFRVSSVGTALGHTCVACRDAAFGSDTCNLSSLIYLTDVGRRHTGGVDDDDDVLFLYACIIITTIGVMYVFLGRRNFKSDKREMGMGWVLYLLLGKWGSILHPLFSSSLNAFHFVKWSE